MHIELSIRWNEFFTYQQSLVTGQYLEKIEWGNAYRPGRHNLKILFVSNPKKKYLCVHGEYANRRKKY
jgi:hypothetical protein